MITFCLILGAIIGLLAPSKAFKSNRRSGSIWHTPRHGRKVRYI